MQFQIETKVKVEGFWWTERETVQVNTISEKEGRATVQSWADDRYPTLDVWVSRIMHDRPMVDVVLS